MIFLVPLELSFKPAMSYEKLIIGLSMEVIIGRVNLQRHSGKRRLGRSLSRIVPSTTVVGSSVLIKIEPLPSALRT